MILFLNLKSTKIKQLKERINEQKQVNVSHQHHVIILDGKVLRDEATLRDYHVTTASFLVWFVKRSPPPIETASSSIPPPPSPLASERALIPHSESTLLSSIYSPLHLSLETILYPEMSSSSPSSSPGQSSLSKVSPQLKRKERRGDDVYSDKYTRIMTNPKKRARFCILIDRIMK